ncbi:putative methyltransferase DDB_G0268948 [Penaeus japonicus]|uniref:putative methyltransferase DDB_G0268948 n=1 Tax=Penaeus japonicus TaxID=27405 RepID=UPI001C713ABD|nr:putative methyltransferase DDB_G0268948 [Penaeus japonicus]
MSQRVPHWTTYLRNTALHKECLLSLVIRSFPYSSAMAQSADRARSADIPQSADSAQSADMVFASKNLVEKYVTYRPCPPESLVRRVLDFLKEKPGPLDLCMDVGCGSSRTLKLYAALFNKVVGVDVSQDQLEAARVTCPLSHVTFVEGSAEQLPASDASVDLITCCAAVHWFDLPKFYAEVDRVLRPGGVLSITATEVVLQCSMGSRSGASLWRYGMWFGSVERSGCGSLTGRPGTVLV